MHPILYEIWGFPLRTYGVMLAVALIVNNIPKERKYPEFWV